MPPVGGLGLDREDLRHRDDEIRLADVPAVGVVELARRGHVGGVAARRAGGGPGGERLDFTIGQRGVVLELADADGAVHVPGRHLPRLDALLDRPSPGPRVLVGEERHRHVFGERNLGGRRRGGQQQ
jgi:hypothetical protein